ncbi:MAG TPA: hypothetical protein VMV49_13175 [Candidatus Deferrimicrobium sp.]|nr:hypothetical protein [Candidatus Deferrimicrobium sp.]
MAKGIVLIGWTNKEGFFLIHKHPADVILNEEEVMRIGSTHRMRNLDANTITLREKELNVVSFFSGLINSKYHIAPNFVISLLLEKEENPRDYIDTLPKGSEIVLSEFPVKRFDARTTTFQNVLSNIGKSYLQTLPKLYNALINREIEIKADMDSFFDSVARDLATSPSSTVSDIKTEGEIMELKNKIEEQNGVIKMLQSMLEGRDFSGASSEYISKIETLKTQLSSIENRLKERDTKISELEIQLSRIDILQTRIQSLQTEKTEKDAEIAELRTRLTASTGLPSESINLGTGSSASETQVWKNKALELQQELREQAALINKLKTQVMGHFNKEETRALLADLSQRPSFQLSLEEESDDEMKSRYIPL